MNTHTDTDASLNREAVEFLWRAGVALQFRYTDEDGHWYTLIRYDPARHSRTVIADERDWARITFQIKP